MADQDEIRRVRGRGRSSWRTVSMRVVMSLVVVGVLGFVVSRYLARTRAVRVTLAAHDGIPLLTAAPVTENGPSESFTGPKQVRSEIEQQVVNAMVLEERMQVSPTPATTPAAQAKVAALFPSVFTPAQAARERTILARSSHQGDGIHPAVTPTAGRGPAPPTARTTATSATYPVVDGGIDWARFQSVTPSGTTAVATARVRTWLSSGAIGGKSVDRPTNTLVVRVTLRREPRGWLVDTIYWRFAPGGGP